MKKKLSRNRLTEIVQQLHAMFDDIGAAEVIRLAKRYKELENVVDEAVASRTKRAE